MACKRFKRRWFSIMKGDMARYGQSVGQHKEGEFYTISIYIKGFAPYMGKYNPVYYPVLIVGFIIFLAVSGCGETHIDRILITPENKLLSIGESIEFTAVGLSKKGEAIPDLIFQWSSDSNEIGSVDRSGRFTAHKAGKVIIRASTEGMVGTVEVIVQESAIPDKEIQTQKGEPPEVLEIEHPPEIVIIDNKDFKARKKGPVKLDHKGHSEKYEIDCRQCHHNYQDGKNVWTENDPIESCASCHDPEEKQGKVLKLQNAYHTNCRDCHQELVKQGKSESAPYRKCTDCHL